MHNELSITYIFFCDMDRSEATKLKRKTFSLYWGYLLIGYWGWYVDSWNFLCWKNWEIFFWEICICLALYVIIKDIIVKIWPFQCELGLKPIQVQSKLVLVSWWFMFRIKMFFLFWRLYIFFNDGLPFSTKKYSIFKINF